MKQIISRLSSPTPVFWKKVQAFGAGLGIFATGLTQIPHAPALFIVISTNVAIAGGVIVLIGQLACNSNNPIDKTQTP